MERELCIHDEFCGGCIYGGVEYAKQLQAKEEIILDQLSRRRVDTRVFKGLFGREDGRYQYRNKMEYTFGDLVKDGPMTLGMHKIKQFMSIITVDNCQLVPMDFNRILKFTLDFCLEKGYKHYNKKSHLGLLRNLIVRHGLRTDEITVNIVTTTQEEFDSKSYVEGLLDLKLDNKIVGIMQTENDNIADAVKCENLRVLYGREYYREVINDLNFKVGPFSFFQTNVKAAEELYLEGISLIENIEDKVVFDLYCGTGTISQILAKKAKKVVGVELVEEAVDFARENAKENGLTNCQFIAGDVFEVLNTIDEKPEIIVVDPPRVGMSTKAVEKISSYGIPEILYISCNPNTMSINLEEFSALGYKPTVIKAFDNFPCTKHAEAICLLKKLIKKKIPLPV